MKKIMIAIPAYRGSVSVQFTDAMVQTIKLGLHEGINFIPVFMPGEAMVCKARNDLLMHAINSDVEGMLWIDDDMVWIPHDAVKIVNRDKDFVSGVYFQKQEENKVIVVRVKEGEEKDGDFIKVLSCGFGFCYMSRKCFQTVWDTSAEYKLGGQTAGRRAFEIGVDEDGELFSEDISVAKKWPEIYLDTTIICGHMGTKIY